MTRYSILTHSRERQKWEHAGTVKANNDSAAIGLVRLQGLVPESTPVKAEPRRPVSKRPKRKGRK